jgi:hypothetical protein
MAQDIIANDLHVAGALTARAMTLPSGTVTDNSVAAGAGIDSTKLETRPKITTELFAQGTTVAAVTKWLHIVRGATGTIKNIGAMIAAAITGDNTVTIDLKKSTGGGAFATVLTGTFGFSSASAVRTLVNGTISSAALVAGDILQVVVTVAGTGTQAQGLTVSLQIEEDPQ